MFRSLVRPVARSVCVRRHLSTASTSTGRSLDDAPEQDFVKLDLEQVEFRQPVFVNEEVENKRKRLSYQSSKRGMLEMDNLFAGFAHKYLQAMTDDQLAEYDKILRETDTHLYQWLVKGEMTPDDMRELATYRLLEQFAASGELETFRDHLIEL